MSGEGEITSELPTDMADIVHTAGPESSKQTLIERFKKVAKHLIYGQYPKEKVVVKVSKNSRTVASSEATRFAFSEILVPMGRAVEKEV